jgi:hypothetical protein
LGADDTAQAGYPYGPSTAIRDIQIAGEIVTAVRETGEDQATVCSKYQNYPCPSPLDTLLAVDVGARRSGTLAQIAVDEEVHDGGTLRNWERTLASPQHAAAWLEHTETVGAGTPPGSTTVLYGCRLTPSGANGLQCAASRLGAGNIDARSLSFAGTKLSWTQDGAPQSATL